MTANEALLIGIVGPCGSGKSTLANALDQRGYSTRHIAQEHSYVKDMWKRITNPDVLIFLQASFPVTKKRKQKMILWTEKEFSKQERRLAHALSNADLVIETDSLSEQEVLEKTMAFIRKIQTKN